VQFQDLAAAYQLLTSSHLVHSANSSSKKFTVGKQTAQAADNWPSFEAAYATGVLFCEQLLDEAVIHGSSSCRSSNPVSKWLIPQQCCFPVVAEHILHLAVLQVEQIGQVAINDMSSVTCIASAACRRAHTSLQLLSNHSVPAVVCLACCSHCLNLYVLCQPHLLLP